MLLKIIHHTPAWVFVLFFVLLAYGYAQTRGKQVPAYRVAILPGVMLLLSITGLLAAFGINLHGVLSWLLGIGVAVLPGLMFASHGGARYSAETRLFYVPGSWTPLALMMAIFFTKYAVGVILTRHLNIANAEAFILGVGFVYGFFSGLFLSRALAVWNVKGRQTAPDVKPFS